MDQNSYNPPTGGQPNQPPEPPAGPLIRTMAKDIEALGKKPSEEPAAFQPPAGYEPPPEMPLGMAPPMEIPAPPADLPSEAQKAEEETAPPSPAQQIPEETAAEMPPPPPPPTAPVGPTETVISEKALTEFAPPQPPKKDIKKLAFIAGIVGAAVIFGFLGWFLYPKIFPTATPIPTPVFPTPTPETPVPTPEPTPPPTPISITFFQKTPEKTAVLDIDAQTKTELVKTIENERQEQELVGTLKIIDLRQGGIIVAFDQFANLMGLGFPMELKNLISPEFKLFVNSHAQEGNKIGLILFVSDPEKAESELEKWENTMDADLVDLFLEADPGEKAAEFGTTSYRGIVKRYLSFSKPPFSIDYGIHQNFLVIGTSRFSFTNAIDHILGEE